MATRTRSAAGVFERVYTQLLRLYPAAFRERFTQEMLELLAARRERMARQGGLRRRLFPVVAIVDRLASAWRERRRDPRPRPSGQQGLAAMALDDVRVASRRLRRSPALSLTVIGLLALAIGTAVVVFSVVNTVLLRPLPFANPDRIAIVWEKRGSNDQNVVGGHEFPVWARNNQTFEALAAIIDTEGVHLTGAGEPASLLGMRVSASFFQVMGVAPALGRAFTNLEDAPGHGGVVVISDRLWRQRFGADRGVLDRDIRLNGSTMRIVGVMPSGFGFPPGGEHVVPDLWWPIAESIERYRGRHYLVVVGRLKNGVGFAQAQADLSAIASSLERELPEFNKGHEVNVLPLQQYLVRDARASLLLLLGAVGCLLLIGCSNVAGLLLARGVVRRREVALELALGATRMRVAGQLLVESLFMSLAGGIVGFGLAVGFTRLVPALVPPAVLGIDAIAIDGVVVAFAVGVSMLTGLLFGIAPALQLRGFGLADTLRRGGRSLRSVDHPRLRRALVSGQIALTVMLVLGAGLMMRALISIQRIDPGFNTAGTLTLDVALRGPRYEQPLAQREFFDDLTARLQAISGVIAVGASNSLPLSGSGSGIAIVIDGRPDPGPGSEATAQYRVVGPGYFRTIGARIVQGREFEASDARLALPLIRWYPQQPQPPMFDRPQAMPVVVINESMAKKYWPGESPIGQKFQVLMSPMLTIVGVAADTRSVTLRSETGPEFYLCSLQEPQNSMGLMIRASVPPANLVPAARTALQHVDPNLPITSIRTLDELRGVAFDQPRFMSMLFGAFALMALLLMVAGIYGLLAFTTAQRMPEMGIRLALGAPRTQLHELVLRDALSMTAVGLGAGLVAAMAFGRVLSDQLFGVPALDPFTYVVVTTLVIAIVLVACWLPARRAAGADPLTVLRQE